MSYTTVLSERDLRMAQPDSETISLIAKAALAGASALLLFIGAVWTFFKKIMPIFGESSSAVVTALAGIQGEIKGLRADVKRIEDKLITSEKDILRLEGTFEAFRVEMEARREADQRRLANLEQALGFNPKG